MEQLYPKEASKITSSPRYGSPNWVAEHQLREVIEIQGRYINNELDADSHGRRYKPIDNLTCKKKEGIFTRVYTIDRWATVLGRFGASHNIDLDFPAFTILCILYATFTCIRYGIYKHTLVIRSVRSGSALSLEWRINCLLLWITL